MQTFRTILRIFGLGIKLRWFCVEKEQSSHVNYIERA